MKRRAHLPNTQLLKKMKNGSWRAKVAKNGTYKHKKPVR